MKRLATAVLAAALLTGCAGDGGDDDQLAATPSPTPSAGTASPTPCESAAPAAEPQLTTTTDLSVKPELTAGSGAPPCELVTRDVVVGTGAEVVEGSQVRVKYVGAFYDTGEQFDASWDRSSPQDTLPFVAGGGSLIPGFDQGVLGMKVGGRREIVIPSDLGYGPQGSGPIPGGATLVFVVDVVDVQAPQ